MRTVLLTGDGPEHRYVARRLAQCGAPLTAVLVSRPPSRTRSERISTARRRFGMRGAALRLATGAVLRLTGEAQRRRDEVVAILSDRGMPEGLPVLEVRGVNTVATQDVLRNLAVDLLCVYGTAVVGDKTLSCARDVAVNLHTGISPRYRGADCAFWPLHNREPEWLGATVHVCTSALDGGAIYATTRAALSPDDGIGGAFARTVVAGADALARVVEDLSVGSAVPRPQDLSLGREYRAVMRDWRAELRTTRAVRAGMLRRHVNSLGSGPL